MGIINYFTGESEPSAEIRRSLPLPMQTRFSILELADRVTDGCLQLQDVVSARSQIEGREQASSFINHLLQPMTTESPVTDKNVVAEAKQQIDEAQKPIDVQLDINEQPNASELPMEYREFMVNQARLKAQTAHQKVQPADVHEYKLNA